MGAVLVGSLDFRGGAVSAGDALAAGGASPGGSGSSNAGSQTNWGGHGACLGFVAIGFCGRSTRGAPVVGAAEPAGGDATAAGGSCGAELLIEGAPLAMIATPPLAAADTLA